MGRIRLLSHALILFLLTEGDPARGQPLDKLAGTYYRSNPFTGSFSGFVQHLLNDPTLETNQLTKKSDSLLFFLEGVYRSHRPFFFRAERCRVILAEVQEYTPDSSGNVYTHYVYQLIGYAPPGESGKKEVEQEFASFSRKYRKGFRETTVKDLTSGGKITGQIRDFATASTLFFPLTCAWSSKDGKENLFVITLRFLVVENQAFFPAYQ